MTDLKERIKRALVRCVQRARAYQDPTEMTACFLACLSEELRKVGARLQVTGGFAVELFTGSTYRTADVDIKVDKLEVLRALEEALDEVAVRGGREWALKGLLKALDLLPPPLEQAIEVVTPCGTLVVESPERILVRYLAAWKFWNSTEDRDKALMLAYAWRDQLDWERVRELAIKEQVEDKLGELFQWLEASSGKS